MHRVIIVGAGQLGSRHLQALANVTTPLDIQVIDPSADSLKTAKERYESFVPTSLTSKNPHTITFNESIQSSDPIDIAIVATSSNVRRTVVEQLLNASPVAFMILEKILFGKLEDYAAIQKLLNEKHCAAWVNCSMRMMPFYRELKNRLDGSPLHYEAIGSQFGLITNSIHYIDHIAYLTGGTEFTVDTSELDPQVFESKRKGFLEINGALTVRFANGSTGRFTCYKDGDAPIQVNVFSKTLRCISRESEKKAWVAESSNAWAWQEEEADIPYQSSMTTKLVENILDSQTCSLVSFEESAKLHIPLLESLLAFLNTKTSQQFDHYPFT